MPSLYTRLALVLTLTFAVLILGSCKTPDASSEEAEKQHLTSDIMTLARVTGCRRCHRVKGSVVGPAWVLISERYKDAPDAKPYLMEKVRKGGSGNWNDITAGATMPPHEGLISEQHFERLIDYILSLKRET